MAKNTDSSFKVKVPKLKVTSRTYDFSLSLPGMISAVGAGVLALTFFFVMGILIGRGYRPETDVPQLGEIMPDQQHEQAAETPLKPEILTTEELDYPERVRLSPEKAMDTQPSPAQPKPSASAKKSAPDKAAATQKDKAVTTAPEPVAPGKDVYDYVYQVASFRKSSMADDLAAKLQKAGLRTAIQSAQANGKTWYRVQVLHRGTPASTAEMKSILTQYGVGKPLLKKKKLAQ